jgi:hypothetical protein
LLRPRSVDAPATGETADGDKEADGVGLLEEIDED